MTEEKHEKLPIDAKLLSEAVIELNISRRSVGLYPPEHPILKDSINRAFEHLQKLFELRSNITLGIAKNTLIIDEYTLDRKNPVFEEFALSLHNKGIAAVTFYSGLEPQELICLHEMITMRDNLASKALLELSEKKGLRHIKLIPIDLSSFSFVEGQLRPGEPESKIWEDYIYGLLEGKIADRDAEFVVFNIPPEQVAEIINIQMSKDSPDETYDRVITAYLRKKEHVKVSKKHFERFASFIESLSPELKIQFLRRAVSQPAAEASDIEVMLANIKEEDLYRMLEVFKQSSTLIPESIRNLVDKLTKAKSDTVSEFTRGLSGGRDTSIDDIEIDENIIRLFEKDGFSAFVSEQYRKELEAMLQPSPAQESWIIGSLRQECSENIVDRTMAELTLELLDSDLISHEDYLNLLAKLSDFANTFLDTGRFSELHNIYTVIHSHSIGGRFAADASKTVGELFHSEQFISKTIDMIRLWGRQDRDGTIKFAGALKQYLTNPLFDALSNEPDPAIRKFLLNILRTFGDDIIQEAIKRLSDNRWYVVRNMIYLIRECGGEKYQKEYLKHIRELARNKNDKICMEAVKTLFHLNTPDAPSYLKFYLRSDNPDLREQAVKLSGVYKVKETVPYLIELLERKDPIGTELYNKVLIIKTLGEIADIRALDTLKKLYNSKSLLFRGALDELKVEIFKTLHNYPFDAAKPLLELGMASRNEEIKSISKRLLKAVQ